MTGDGDWRLSYDDSTSTGITTIIYFEREYMYIFASSASWLQLGVIQRPASRRLQSMQAGDVPSSCHCNHYPQVPTSNYHYYDHRR